jgi:hypothetical protein
MGSQTRSSSQFKRESWQAMSRRHSLNGNDLPAVYVSWDDAKALRKVAKQHQEICVPPADEAEWE